MSSSIGVNVLSVLLATLVLGSCSASAPLTSEFLDPDTGVTITNSVTPLVFYRDDPSQAAYARNYIHVGPIDVNRSGSHRYYLWFGIWNNMQATDAATQRDGFEEVTVFVDGEPFPLALAGWTPAAIGGSRSIYLKPVATAADAYYEVAADQIRLIANGTDIRIRTSGASPIEFTLWDSQRDARQRLLAFVQAVQF